MFKIIIEISWRSRNSIQKVHVWEHDHDDAHWYAQKIFFNDHDHISYGTQHTNIKGGSEAVALAVQHAGDAIPTSGAEEGSGVVLDPTHNIFSFFFEDRLLLNFSKDFW